MRTWAWASFWILGFIWGSSFLLIRVGVGAVSPAQLVFIRTIVAAIGLNAVLLMRGKRLPTETRAVNPGGHYPQVRPKAILSGGSIDAAKSRSANPTTERSRGIFIPSSAAAW